MKDEDVLKKASELLQKAGYTLTKGISVNVSDIIKDCGGSCDGGCGSGCYTCAPGSSNKRIDQSRTVIIYPKEAIFEEFVTLVKDTEKQISK